MKSLMVKSSTNWPLLKTLTGTSMFITRDSWEICWARTDRDKPTN